MKDSSAPLHQLRHSLRQRHMTMIAFGGVIGAGLFVGSGVVIRQTGPAAVISFVITGLLVVLVMRMLGELAVALPAVGSFYEYARRAFSDRPRLGALAGFLTGWMYWYFWVIVVALEAVAGAGLIRVWLPHEPGWLISLTLLLMLTVTNLISVKVFGEFEFWFASIKVVAIVIFLVLAATYVLGLWPATPANFANLSSNGGFAPTRVAADHDRCGGRHGFLLWRRTGRRRGGRNGRARQGGGERDEFGDHARVDLLCGLGAAGGLPGTVEFKRHRDSVCQRVECHGYSGRSADHERRGPHGRAVGAELRSVRVLADAVRAHRSRRCAAVPRRTQSQRCAAAGDPARHAVRLWGGGHVLHCAGYDLCLPGQFLRYGGHLRLSVHRDLAASTAGAAGTGGPRASAAADVAVPLPDLPGDRGNDRDPAGDGIHPRSAYAADLRTDQFCDPAVAFVARARFGSDTAVESQIRS